MPDNRLIGLPPSDNTPEARGTNWLLVIGIDNYAHHPRLHKAVADAQGFAEMLTQHYGFEHLDAPLYNEVATQHNIRKALSKCKTLGEHDRLIVFYAGHGWYEAKTKLGHIVPTDAENNPDSDFIPTNFITNIFQGVDAKHILLVVDCCFGGSFGVERTLLDVETAKKVNAQLDSRRSRMVLSSGGIEPVSDGLVSANNSPFTSPLLDILEENKARLMVFSEVFTLLRKKANWATSQQLPQYKVLQGLGHDDGELGFYCTDPEPEKAEEADVDAAVAQKFEHFPKVAKAKTPTPPPEDTLKTASQVFLGSLVISVPIAAVYAVLFYFLFDTHSHTYIYVAVLAAIAFPVCSVLSIYNEGGDEPKREGWAVFGMVGLPILVVIYTIYAGYTGDFKLASTFGFAKKEVPQPTEDPSVKTTKEDPSVKTAIKPASPVDTPRTKLKLLPKGTIIGVPVKQ